jgi:small subunit ribosomal protein S6
MRTYEVLFIMHPQTPEEGVTQLVSDFRGVIEKSGGTVSSEEAWGRRRLAYPIEKLNDGIYHLYSVQSEAELSEVDRRMKNSDQILRHIIVRTDLEQKRATKLALKNPKKPRTGAPGTRAAVQPAAAPSEATPAPVEAAPETAPEAPVEMAPETAPEAPVETADTAPADAPATALADEPAPADEPTTTPKATE